SSSYKILSFNECNAQSYFLPEG
ncbi:MAG: hypothetical protein JWQ03_1198, partial [Variovorax sp.]|nr:hypothetical protein [Variovorax sp.]